MNLTWSTGSGAGAARYFRGPDFRRLARQVTPVLDAEANLVLRVTPADRAAPRGLNMAETEMLSPAAAAW
jgi:hypothetical protein